MLEENLPDVPHLQGPDRVGAGGRAVEELESEVLVLDDGFQHRRLHRDLDLVLIDATGRRARPPVPARPAARAGERPAPGRGDRADAVRPGAGGETWTSFANWVDRRFPGMPVAATVHRPAELAGRRTNRTG